MNNHYPYGYSPYPGQPPPAQPYSYPTFVPPYPAPAQTFPPPTNNAFDAHNQIRDSYDQTSTMIPGLGYSQPQLGGYGWQQAVQTPQIPEAPAQQWPSREEPKLIPASQYYQVGSSVGDAPNGPATVDSGLASLSAPQQTTARGREDAEEGELSEGELEDVYDPAETLVNAPPRPLGEPARAIATANARTGNADAEPAAAGWFDGSGDSVAQSAAVPIAASEHPPADDGRDIEPNRHLARERSGSYSPYLSPREVQPPTSQSTRQDSTQQAQVSVDQANHASVPGITQTGSSVLIDARKKAQAAILNLWPLDIRYQQYVDEGIDGKIVKDLFNDLGLDTSNSSNSGPSTTVPREPSSSQLPGTSATSVQSNTKPPGVQNSAPLPKPAQNQASSLPPAKSAGEERKDRIARLLAAKGTKPATSISNSGSQLNSKTPSQAAGKSDKELIQQQKLDALIKSREARAQKAAERKDSLQSSQSKKTSPTPVTSQLPSSSTAPPAPSVPSRAPRAAFSQEPAAQPSSTPTTSIPGLFLSGVESAPVIRQRKRPVATDFVSSSQPAKRSFGHQRPDKPFVIDVSDSSDDEDVEMDIGSPTDDPTISQRADTPSRKTASFRDFPPLSDGHSNLSPAASNIATPQTGVIASQPKQAHLEVMDKQIEAMKRKIALAEARRKLKAAMNGQSSAPKSKAQTPETAGDSDGSKPGIRRVQSMEASDASARPDGRSSPIVTEASGSTRLPKPSDKMAEGGSSRAERLRDASTNLPLVETRLQAKKSKLRLLQSQVARLQKEIEEEDAEKEKLTHEMEQLHQDSDDESEERQNQLQIKSVDPLINHTPSRPQPTVRTTVPVVGTTWPALSANEAAAPAPSSADVSRPEGFVFAHTEKDTFTTVQEADGAVHGKTATPPHEAPDCAENVLPDAPETLVDQVASVDGVERSQCVSSDGPSDVVMGESDDSTSQEPGQESSNADDPPESVDLPDEAKSPSVSPLPADSAVSLATSDTDLQQQPSSRASPVPQQISLGVNESSPEQGVDVVIEAPQTAQSTDEISTEERFTPYESPLQCFRAYRYHPNFAETVAGGLRSLTYSNRIDLNLPICPDQLANRECPRGADCIYQHFESMKLPDDQILLQLGGTTLEGPEKTQFNEGLRKLLQDMRSQNIKDFPSIAKGIIDYHNRFIGDPSKILPLGNVSI